MSFFTSKIFIIGLSLLAVLSPFFFPKAITVLLAVLAGFYIPILPLFVGAITDILYYPPHALPVGLFVGGLISLITFGVRYFIRTRIM